MSGLLQSRYSFISTVVSKDASNRAHIRARLLTIPVALIAASALISPSAVRAQGTPSYGVIHRFSGAAGDGGAPAASLLLGTDGNFYGTTGESSAPDHHNATNGGVFKITPDGAVTVLHQFYGATVPGDGAIPAGPVILGRDGNFYGTTGAGGTAQLGTVYKVTLAGNTTILHSFGDGSAPSDGTSPSGGLIQGPDGNFYGTTSPAILDASSGSGTFYRITPAGVLTVLHKFGDGSTPNDGKYPGGSLTLGPDGNLYGTTSAGGSANFGTVFKVTPAGKVTTLHSFDDGTVSQDGASPSGSLLLGSDGYFYGTTGLGGAKQPPGIWSGGGTVFKIAPGGTYAILHRFQDGSVVNDGSLPNGALIQASDGNFYGTTSSGGPTGSGTVYKMAPGGDLTILHFFSDGSVPDDGAVPFAGLTQGLDGNLYGTTYGGGVGSVSTTPQGTVYELSLGLPPLIPAAPTGVTATSGAGQITLSWVPAPGAQSYYIYRGTARGGESGIPIASAVTSTTFVDTQVQGGVTYYYKIRSKSARGASSYSIEASATPAPATPTLNATAGNAQANLSWTASSGATSYNVYRGTAPGGESATPIAAGVTGTTFTDTSVRNQVRYYYYVVAIGSAGASQHSNEVLVLPLPAAPAAPSLTATPGNKQITLTWTLVSGATGYKLYRGTSPGGESATAIYGANATTTMFVNPGLTNGVTYYYRVTAINPGGASPYSNEASATPAP